MKIKTDNTVTYFVDLNYASCFKLKDDDGIFMKIYPYSSEPNQKNSVRLDSGQLVKFKQDKEIIPVDGTFVENYKE